MTSLARPPMTPTSRVPITLSARRITIPPATVPRPPTVIKPRAKKSLQDQITSKSNYTGAGSGQMEVTSWPRATPRHGARAIGPWQAYKTNACRCIGLEQAYNIIGLIFGSSKHIRWNHIHIEIGLFFGSIDCR